MRKCIMSPGPKVALPPFFSESSAAAIHPCSVSPKSITSVVDARVPMNSYPFYISIFLCKFVLLYHLKLL